MNKLAKLLIKNLLPESIDGKEVTALFGGGFKPPTAGHLKVVKSAIEKYPEIDNVIIYVGKGERDGITQDQSFKVWEEHYKKLIDKPTRILKAEKPIGSIYSYAKNHPEDIIYYLLGEREGKKEDQQDIINRTKSTGDYPNIKVRIIKTPDGGMSGTNAREAIINNDKESFKPFIPNESDEDEIWDILTSQPLNESSVTIDMDKVNKALRKGIGHDKETDDNILSTIDAHPPGKVPHPVFLDHYSKFDKYFGEKHDNRTLDEIGLEHLLVNVLNLSSEEIKKIMYDYQQGNKDLEDISWFEKYDEENPRDEEWNPVGGDKFDDSKDNKQSVNKYLSKNKRLSEGEPKKGTGKKPKGSGRRLYTDEDPSDTVKVKFSTKQDIVDTLNKKSFKSKSHARQSQIINLIHQRVRAALGRTKDPQKKAKLRSAFEYIKNKKEASKKKTQRLKKQKNENVAPNHDGKAAPFGSGYKKYKKVDETGLKVAKKNMDDYKKSNQLNENATYSNHIDYKQEIIDLTKHMLKKGMNIQPLPKIVFKHGDKENAQDFLGRTAYYDPNNMMVVLYTEGRHPKDIARSYAHEMIHHIQNLEGRLENISTTNTMKDDYLNDIEREAYTKGNMLFRNYTDGKDGEEVTSLNEKEKPYKHKYGFNDKLGKDPFGLNAYARELATLEEGRYDTLSNQISKDIFSNWKEDFEDGDEVSTYEDTYDFPPRGIDVKAQIQFTPGLKKLKIDGGSDEARTNPKTNKKLSGYLEVTFEIDPKMLPEFWEEISMNLKDVVRHEIEHITQSGDSKVGKLIPDPENPGEMKWTGKDFEDDSLLRALIKADLLPQAKYFELDKEIDAQLQGMYFRAKKEKRPLKDVIDTYLDAQDINSEEKEKILDLWRKRNKALNLPSF